MKAPYGASFMRRTTSSPPPFGGLFLARYLIARGCFVFGSDGLNSRRQVRQTHCPLSIAVSTRGSFPHTSHRPLSLPCVTIADSASVAHTPAAEQRQEESLIPTVTGSAPVPQQDQQVEDADSYGRMPFR